jgi:hypothetical protein
MVNRVILRVKTLRVAVDNGYGNVGPFHGRIGAFIPLSSRNDCVYYSPKDTILPHVVSR